MRQNKKKEVKRPIITGIILPSQWDNQGKTTRISIHASDESEYLVDYSGLGRELLNLIQKKVEVKGKIRERLNGSIFIQVHSYELIEDQVENSKP